MSPIAAVLPTLLISSTPTQFANSSISSHKQQITETPVGSSDHTASPYSIFWALVAIAVASITQPTSLLYSYPHQEIYPAHSSPIICGFDALNALLLFLTEVSRQVRIREWNLNFASPISSNQILETLQLHWNDIDFQLAAWKATRLRPRPVLWVDSGDVTTDQENRAGRRKSVMMGTYVLFILGSFLQVVKLMAIEGIPWTKTWALLYVISFAFLNILRFASGRVEEGASLNEDHHEQINTYNLTRIIVILSIGGQILLWSWVTFDLFPILRTTCRPDFQANDCKWGLWAYLLLLVPDSIIRSIIMMVPLFALTYLSYFLLQFIPTTGNAPFFPLISLILLCMLLSLPFVGFYLIFFNSLFLLSLDFGLLSGIIYYAFLLPFVAQFLIRLITCKSESDSFWRRNLNGHWSMLVFLSPFVNFLLTFLWYSNRYDPSTTYKPGWTDKLG